MLIRQGEGNIQKADSGGALGGGGRFSAKAAPV